MRRDPHPRFDADQRELLPVPRDDGAENLLRYSLATCARTIVGMIWGLFGIVTLEDVLEELVWRHSE